MDKNKELIIKDFGIKKETYFSDNYSLNSNAIRIQRRKFISSQLKEIKSINNVLDVGCGPAILYEELLSETKNYYALDLVKSNLDSIKEKFKSKNNIRYINGDIDSIEIDNKYDVIICSGVLEYTDRPYYDLQKMFKLLNTNGILIASFPNVISIYRLWSEYVYKHISKIINHLKNKEVNYYRRRLFSLKKLKKQVTGSNVNIEVVEMIGLKLIIQPFDKIFPKVDKYLIGSKLSKSFLKIFSQEILLTFIKN